MTGLGIVETGITTVGYRFVRMRPAKHLAETCFNVSGDILRIFTSKEARLSASSAEYPQNRQMKPQAHAYAPKPRPFKPRLDPNP